MPQVEEVTLDNLISEDHVDRQISQLFPTEIISTHLSSLKPIKGADGRINRLSYEETVPSSGQIRSKIIQILP